MADWIKWTKGLPDKPEVIRLAGRLGLTREAAVCKLMRFWEWCDDNIPRSDIRENGSAFVTLSPRDGDNVAFIDALVGTPGFADSLSAVDWLRCRDGRIELPNFGRHNGETAKTRARNAKNQQRIRTGSDGDCGPDQNQGGVGLSPKMSPPSGDKTVTRGEESNEEVANATSSRAPPKKPRPRNALFDALAEVTGSDATIPSKARQLGTMAAELAKADPPYSPEEVREFARRFHELCPWAAQANRARPTPGEVRNHIGLLRASEPEKPTPKPLRPVLDFANAEPLALGGNRDDRP